MMALYAFSQARRQSCTCDHNPQQSIFTHESVLRQPDVSPAEPMQYSILNLADPARSLLVDSKAQALHPVPFCRL